MSIPRKPLNIGTAAQSNPSSRSMPELGAMPLRGVRTGAKRVVRLVSTTPGADLSIELLPGLNKIGRQRAENHIVLVSPQVSRFHAEIDVSDHDLLLRDLGSGNGTYLNGTIVHEHKLQAGDLIAFSDRFTFRVMVDLATEPPETVTLDGVGAASAAPKTPSAVDAPVAEAPEPPLSPATPAIGPTNSAAVARRTIPGASAGAPAAIRPPQIITTSSASEKRMTGSANLVPDSLAKRTAALKQSSPGLDTETLRAISKVGLPVKVPTQVRPIPIPPQTDSIPPELAQAENDKLPDDAKTTFPGIPVASTNPTPIASRAIAPSQAARDDATELSRQARASGSTGNTDSAQPIQLDAIEQEKRRLSVLYQVSKRFMSATSLGELDAALVNVLERTTAFDRGFVTYQMAAGDWKLVMSPKGDRWERRVVRQLLQRALRADGPIAVTDSQVDPQLGSAPDGRSDQRILLPLRCADNGVGAIFLVAARPGAFEGETLDFLSLFSDIAALAISNASQLDE